MKKLIITALAFTVLATTSALAQTSRARMQTASMTTNSYVGRSGYQAYASAPGSSIGTQPGVYAYGQYRGWDPDPNIRFQLMRELSNGD